MNDSRAAARIRSAVPATTASRLIAFGYSQGRLRPWSVASRGCKTSASANRWPTLMLIQRTKSDYFVDFGA